jgi:hypothetical protein
MTNIQAWIKDKWGRLVTALGAIASAAGTAVASLPDSANDWLPHVITLTSAKVGAGIMLTVLFVASHMRHRKAAATVNTLTQPLP